MSMEVDARVTLNMMIVDLPLGNQISLNPYTCQKREECFGFVEKPSERSLITHTTSL